MGSSGALRWILAALAVAAAAYHVRHATARRPGSPAGVGLDTDLLHGAMGIAMAAMFLGDLDRMATLWLIGGFAGGTVWFTVGAVRTYVYSGANAASDRSRQSLCCVVMTGMLAATLLTRTSSALAPMAGMGSMTVASLDPRLLLAALLVIQAAVLAWTAQGLRPRSAAGNPVHGYSQLATGVSGAVMLAMML